MTPYMLWLSFLYVTRDFYFLPAMTFTTLIGMFIGSVIYDGDMGQIRKGAISIGCYCSMLFIVTLTRVIPTIPTAIDVAKPLAGLITIAIVTFFYLFGMILGVFITKRAHREL